MNKRLLKAFDEAPSDRVPFWFMRQAGRYLPEYRKLREEQPDFLAFCRTPALCVEAAMQPLRRFGMDAVILFSDILVIPDALGCRVAFIEGQGPVLEPVVGQAAVDALRIDGIEERLQPVFDAVRLSKAAIPPGTSMIGFAGAPWTLAVYMVEGRGGSDGETARTWGYKDENGFGRLIDVLVEATVVHLRGQIEHGAEVIQLFDSWAGLLAERPFRRWVIDPTRRIVDRLKAEYPRVKIIGFPRAAGIGYLPYVAETGVDGIGIDASVPVAWAASSLQPRCLVQGNLDNLLPVIGGSRLEDGTICILEALSDGPFIFNLGHGMLPQTPPDHVGRLAEVVRGWRRG
ncbi:MAG: uroporphyrinogen decarboxylase [Rhodospirillales bacterium]